MRIKVYGKVHLEGVAKKSGNPYNFNQVHYLGKARGVEGQAALALALDSFDYPFERTESRHIFYDYSSDISHFDIVQHSLKIRAVKISSGISVIGVYFGVEHPMRLGIGLEHLLLIGNRIAFLVRAIVSRKATVISGSTFQQIPQLSLYNPRSPNASLFLSEQTT